MIFNSISDTIATADQLSYLDNLLTASNSVENTTLYWRGSDTEGSFLKNIGTPYRPFLKEQFEYWKDKKIEYRYNEYGFRSDDSFKGKGIVCLGCSYTEGIGLPIEYNWGYKLAKKLNTKHFNLGQGALGLDSAYRLLLGFKDKIEFDSVFLLVPPPYRYEWIIHDNTLLERYLEGKKTEMMQWLGQSMGSNFHIKEPFGKFFKSFVFGSTMNEVMYETKAIYALKGLCSELGVNFYYRSYIINNKGELKNSKNNIPARDGHPGSAEQDFYYRDFLNKYNEDN